MARARFIRPEFYTDEKVGALPYGARLLFPGIWCHSDLRGVFEHSARQLRVLVFPFDEGLTSGTVEEWLSQLATAGMVIRFEAEGKTWGFVRRWSEYQDISSREVEIGTRRPQPPGWQMPTSWAGVIEKARTAGRLSKESPWISSGLVLGQTQNRTPTAPPSPSPSPTAPPTPPPPEMEGARAPGGVEDTRRTHLVSLGAEMTRSGEDIFGEWKKAIKGLRAPEVEEIFKAAYPGISWPGEFKAHRKSRGNYA